MLLLTTTRDALLAPLQSVAGIVESATPCPSLSNVLIEKHGDQLTMLATDIEIQIRTTTGGHIGGGDASITVGARKLPGTSCAPCPTPPTSRLTPRRQAPHRQAGAAASSSRPCPPPTTRA